MAIDAIDAQVQGLISNAQLNTQKTIGEEDESDHARKIAEKKIAEKKANLKGSRAQRETFQRKNDLDVRMQQVLGGAAGPEAAEGLNRWQNNEQLQNKLTEAQKNMFREAMAKNPQNASKASQAMGRLSQQPGFQKAVNTSQQAGTLQQGLLQNPGAEKPVSQMLQGRFMQAPKSDQQTKNQFLRFGMQQTSKGQADSVRKAGDMLGTMSKNNIGRGAQRAGMNMVQRQPTNGKAMSNVDAFVENPNVGRMPNFARTKGTELLAKANGSGEVKEGFEKLAAEPKFRGQTAQNQGRFFSTIGTGRPSEFRQITDQSLAALRTDSFPQGVATANESPSLPLQMFFENTVLGQQVVDRLVLLTVEPTSYSHDGDKPSVNNRSHGSIVASVPRTSTSAVRELWGGNCVDRVFEQDAVLVRNQCDDCFDVGVGESRQSRH